MGVLIANKKSYDGVDMRLSFLGAEVINFDLFEYDMDDNSEARYASGEEPVGWSKGRNTYKARLSLGKDEIDQIKAVAPGGNILSIKPFTLFLQYINEDYGTTIDEVFGKFKTTGGGGGTGDMNHKFTHELTVMSIKTRTV